MSSVAASDGTKGCTHAQYHDGLTQPAAMFLTLEHNSFQSFGMLL